MQQQINFYQAEFRTTRAKFSAAMLLMACGAMVLAMLVAFGFQTYKLEGIKSELKTVNNQEQAAIQRLENFQPAGDTDSGGKSWTERLEDAKLSLREQQLVLSMVRDSTLGDTQGFSRHLTSLARLDTAGLWLSYFRLSALGDNTRLAGQALRAELVPAYLQFLAAEPPFASQRFNQFQIDGPEERSGGAVTFSMISGNPLLANKAQGTVRKTKLETLFEMGDSQ